MNPASPVTQKNNTSLSDTFLSKDIIRLYKDQLDIDVAEFFSGREAFFLYMDNDTGYRFYYPGNLAGDGKFYEALQKKLGEEYYHDWKFENQLAFDLVKKNDKVLDIGCGTGNFLLRTKLKTNEVYGLELNENAAAIAKEKGIVIYNELIQDHSKTHGEVYDVVCMFQVLEHIYDVISFLEASLKVLKKGGSIVIGVPNNEPYFLGYDKYCTLNLPPHHMGLWNKSVFEKLSLLFDLKITDIKYDTRGRIKAEAYTRAKYMAGIKSLPGNHSSTEKILILLFCMVTIPLTVIKKLSKGLHGSHLAVVFKK